jgi:hypothetical protein
MIPKMVRREKMKTDTKWILNRDAWWEWEVIRYKLMRSPDVTQEFVVSKEEERWEMGGKEGKESSSTEIFVWSRPMISFVSVIVETSRWDLDHESYSLHQKANSLHLLGLFSLRAISNSMRQAWLTNEVFRRIILTVE